MFKKFKKFLATALVTTVLAAGFSSIPSDIYDIGIQTAFAANTKSLQLNGSSQYLSRTNTSLASGFPGKDYTGDISIMGWIKVTVSDSFAKNICSKFNNSPATDASFRFFINGTNNGLQFQYNDAGGNTIQYSQNSIISTNTWYHVAVTVDVSAQDVKFYINGAQSATQSATTNASTIQNGNAEFFIGAENVNTAQSYFPGYIDELGIYNSILSQATIQTDYNSGAGTDRSASETNIISGYRMEEEGGGEGLLDITTANNDFTNNGTATFSIDVPFSGITETITLTDIADFTGYQRTSSDNYAVPVSGTYTGTPTAIQARVVLDGTSTEEVTWTTIDASPSGGTFSGNITTPTGGWYNVQVRFSNDTGVTDEGTNKWAIGAYILQVGQSQQEMLYSTSSTPPSLTAVSSYYDVRSGDNIWKDYTAGNSSNGNGIITLANNLYTNLGVPIFFIKASQGGSALRKEAEFNATTSYWFDEDTDTEGPLFTKAITQMDALGGKAEYISWVQGEQDANFGGITPAETIDSLTKLIAFFRTDVTTPDSSTIPFLIGIIGRSTDAGSGDADWSNMREALTTVADSNTNNYVSGQLIDLTLADTVHYTPAAYTIFANRIAQTIRFIESDVTYYRGQQIDDYTQVSSSIIDINLNTTTGITNFTPTSAITGFSILDDATPETISTAIQVDANTIRLTIAGTITGTPTVRYLYGANPTVTNPVLGNDALTLPLESNANITELVVQTDNAIFFGITF